MISLFFIINKFDSLPFKFDNPKDRNAKQVEISIICDQSKRKNGDQARSSRFYYLT